jgi:nitrite reductase/ring-hydroxylating ferredoxin subunit
MVSVNVAKLSDFPEGTLKQVKVTGRDDIAIANVGGKIYAMRGVCNHRGGPLGKGKLDGSVVTCPWHGSKWDIKTGKLVEFGIELNSEPTYKTSVVGDDIFVEF